MSLTFRPGTRDDSLTIFGIFEQSIMELGQRLGAMTISGGEDPAVLEQLWDYRGSLFEHLTRTAERFWVAEKNGQVIGYARAILRDGVRELADFFILPSHQSAGVGRELLARAFPTEGATHRVIMATIDSRAMALYLKAGVYPRFPSYYFSRVPERVSVPTDLAFVPISTLPKAVDALGMIDLILLGHRRDVDHDWLRQDRQGYFYYRGGQPVGYGYVGQSSGPFALLDSQDFPAVLAHAESEVAASRREFGVEVPLINRDAVDYLLSRGFQMSEFFTFFASDVPFGTFERYIFTSPPFFL